jgi:hypothetical protein
MSNERRWLKVRDFLTFRPKEVLEDKKHFFECKDSTSETGSSLLVRVNATHAGLVTGNRKFYRPDFMQDSVHTWLPKHKPALPVLRGHSEDGEVLGRVREAKYIDDSWQYAKDYPILKDSVFYNRDARSKKVGLFKAVDWITDNLVPLSDYRGLGHIELGLTITNPEAIKKILRDEYLCVSAGAITDEAICSICHTDWASNDKCEHRPGQLVDGRRMFIISGRFRYEELSFVNFGADPFAAVKTKELKDSLEKMFFLGLPIGDQDHMVEAGLKLTDSLYESDIQIHYEEPEMTIDLAALEQTIKSAELTATDAFAVRDQLLAWTPESEDDKSAKRSLQSTLTAKIRKNSWKQDTPVTVTDAVAAPSAEELATVDKVKDAVDAAAVAAAVTESETPATEVKDKVECFACKAKFTKDKMGVTSDGENVCEECSENIKDAKKATDGVVKISDELKALAVGVKLLDAEEKAEPTEEAKSILGCYETLDKLHGNASQELRWKMEDLHGSIGERWGKDRWVEYAKSTLANHVKDSKLVSNDELALKDEAVVTQEAEITKLQGTITIKDQSIAKFFNDSKLSMATTIVMASVLRQKDGFTGLDGAKIQDKISEYAKRHITSLRDSVADILNELQWAKPVVAAPEAAGKDPATTVTDNAHVSESEGFHPEAQIPELKAQDAQKLNRMLSYITDEPARTRLIADVRWGRTKLS